MTVTAFYETIIKVSKGEMELTEEIKKDFIEISEKALETKKKTNSKTSERNKEKTLKNAELLIPTVQSFSNGGTAAEIWEKYKETEGNEEVTKQKVTSMLRVLREAEKVVKEERIERNEKGKLVPISVYRFV